MSRTKRNRSRFWRIYWILIGCMLLLVASGLAVFYDFIRAYEESQPSTAANAYAAAMNDEILTQWIDIAAEQLDLPYETPRDAANACKESLSQWEGEYSCAREYGTFSSPTYLLYRGDAVIGRFSLTESDAGRYGLTFWKVEQGSALLEEWHVNSVSATICAPAQTVITINGHILTEAPTVTDVVNPSKHALEQDDISAALYEITGLYTEPTISCTLDGEVCPLKIENEIYYFQYPETMLHTYNIFAPDGATVYVNQWELSAEYRTDIVQAYRYTEIEADADGLPVQTQYRLIGMRECPEVTASWNGISLDVVFNSEDSAFVVEYPHELLYSAEIRVPTGSVLTMRGVSCAPYLVGTEEAYPDLCANPDDAPYLDVYRLDSLYLPPDDLCVLYNQSALPMEMSRTGNTFYLSAAYPYTDHEAVSVAALAFAEDYFHYIAMGYNNTDANLSAALAHVQYGCELYQRIQRSQIGIRYVTPVTSQTVRTLDVTDMRLLPDGRIYCLITFDIDQQIYYVHRKYSGTLSLICVQENGGWKIREMLID